MWFTDIITRSPARSRATWRLRNDPQLGDVYRPENIPGFAFEEVTVKSVNETVDGPTGPVEGAIVVQELLMDGLLEDKTFAPGYGEFFFAVEAEEEIVHMALAVPTDAVSGDTPAELTYPLIRRRRHLDSGRGAGSGGDLGNARCSDGSVGHASGRRRAPAARDPDE